MDFESMMSQAQARQGAQAARGDGTTPDKYDALQFSVTINSINCR